MSRTLLAAFSVLVALVGASDVHAYRTASDLPEFGGRHVAWNPAQVTYRLHRDGAPGVDVATILGVAGPAFSTWSNVECTNLQFTYGGSIAGSAAPDDSTNTIEFLRTFWSELGFGEDVMATTDLLYELSDGGAEWRIVEADVYFNAVDYRWAANAGEPASDLRSIRAVLTHEAGHFLGLLHWPCEPGGADDVPDCSTGTGGEAHVMFPLYVGPGHVDLSPDDQAGACALYGCEASCEPGAACITGECRELCGSEACGRGEVCIDGMCQATCAGPPCPPQRFCSSSAECGTGYECRDQTCVAFGGQLSDPCSTDDDCAARLCGADGYCTAGCAEAPCPTGYACEELRSDVPLCVAQGGVLGSECSAPSDCSSRLCLTSSAAPEDSVCTRSCTGPSDCPVDYGCESVEGTLVCVPTVTGGCSVAAVSSARSIEGLAPLAVAALAAIRRRRKVR